MVRLTILLLAAAFPPTLAAQASLSPGGTSLTVEQFEKGLPALHGMRDKQAAHELALMKLTERAGLERAAHWQTEMPGKLSSEALMALVDASGFLDPPAEETPAIAPPTREAEFQIVTQAVDALETTLHKLPNFYAARTTAHFETATPAQLEAQSRALSLRPLEDGQLLPLRAEPAKLPHQELGAVDRAKPEPGRLYFMATDVRSVTYTSGGEVDRVETDARRDPGGDDLGLATSGEFGPILNMVLADALKRGLIWSHWEQGAGGRVAVFRYEVPKDQSHFEIENRWGRAPDYPAYHGELAIDPGSGAILRIAIQTTVTDLDDMWSGADLLVEYGPVDIGGKTYTCPVHGVAITIGRITSEGKEPPAPRLVFLNDTTFTGYHLFRAEVRILP